MPMGLPEVGKARHQVGSTGTRACQAERFEPLARSVPAIPANQSGVSIKWLSASKNAVSNGPWHRTHFDA